MAADRPTAARARIAYLVNHYPAVSHSFIRREIQALEEQGFEIMRIAVRGDATPLADPQDLAERERTRFILREGAGALLAAVCREAFRRPAAMAEALRLALRLSRGSDRPLPYHLVYLAEAAVAAGWLRGAGVRHVHAHFGTNSAEVAALAAILAGATWSFTVHGPDEFDRPQALRLGEKMRRASFVVAVSSFGRSQLMRWIDVQHWPKIQVIHCGLDAAFHGGDRVPVPAARRLVCVGRLSEQKGHLLLLEAMRKVFDRGSEFELVLAGDGELRPRIEANARALGLAAKVRITGWLGSAEVRGEILASRALVLPSFAEGLPVVIMEALALRRPVISTWVAGIPELVTADCGWLVPAGDARALADAMAACLAETPERLDAMGEAGRQRTIARHEVGQEAAKLGALFREGFGNVNATKTP